MNPSPKTKIEGQKTDMVKKIRCKTLLIEDTKYKTLFNKKFENRNIWQGNNQKQIKAFIPGIIHKINIKPGQKVKKGEYALILEAMKMNNQLLIPIDGVINKIFVHEGQCVIKNQVLVELK